ncbi:MAG: hypothetical protein M3R36_02670 [Bacteroidota bacterium]|nr:hypothetical protein [Bacteroidota bacterium]
MKKIIKNSFNSLGFDIVKKKPAAQKEFQKFAVFYDRLENMKIHGFKPKVVFDCGAHKGGWSKALLTHFPEAEYFLFEPNPLLGDKIESNLSKLNINYKLFRNAVG